MVGIHKYIYIYIYRERERERGRKREREEERERERRTLKEEKTTTGISFYDHIHKRIYKKVY